MMHIKAEVISLKEYISRIADTILQDKLESKGAVLVEGAKWCGKTTTAAHAANSIIYMEDPAKKKQYMEMAEMEPSYLLQGEVPHLIDEWQLAPKLWDAVRFEVDQRDDFGQFIMTGSAVPPSTDEISHTGTGRITRMTMRPMSLYESGDSSGEVSIADLFSGKLDIKGSNDANLTRLAYLICRGGWPKAIGCKERVALRQAIDYYDAVVNSDISRVDGVERDVERAKKVLRSYARNTASEASLSSMLQDIRQGEEDTFSEGTLRSYITALKKRFVLEDTTAWNPNIRSKTAIRSSGTRYFVDPSVATAALGVGPKDLINDLNTMGLLFENMCVRDLRVYVESLDGQEYHYRDKSGLECDAVIHLRNGSYGLIEIKLGGDKLIDEGAKTLLKLHDLIDTKKMKKPSFMMVLTGTSPFAYRSKDGVLVVPVTCLKN